jgi:hypothetical protein
VTLETNGLVTAASSTGSLEEVFVLHGRTLRPGYVLEETSRFSDDVWQLTPANHKQHELTLILNFLSIPARYRLTVKQLFYAMLAGPLPPAESRPALVTLRGMFSSVKQFLEWLETHPTVSGRHELSSLVGQDLEDYQRCLLKTKSPGRRGCARAAVRLFWRWRFTLDDRLLFDPTHIDGWGESHYDRAAENATDRIPEQVHGPLLVWALRFIDVFSPDILAVDRQWRHHLRNNNSKVRAASPGRDVGRDLRDLLDDHIAAGRPLPGLPGRTDRPNIQHLANLLGCSSNGIYSRNDQVEAAYALVGATPYAMFQRPITGILDGRPWLAGITTHHTHEHSLAVLARNLQAACYIVLAFLSGCRDSEIKHMRRGCLRIEQDADGVPYRWKIRSLAFKGEADPTGVPATWVVGQPAARAVQVLEALQPPGTDMLFARLEHGPGNKKGHSGSVLVSSVTNRQMRDFRDWINLYCATHGRDDAIPEVNKRPWKLKTSQFRRILSA